MRIWAIANQKGGVGKTTTTLALGRGLATLGHRVLLIDLDPHSSLTRAFGVPLDPPPQGVLELFGAPPAELSSLSRHSDIPGLDYVCAQAALATLERRSANQPGLGLALQNAFARHQGQHDYILLDCAPTLGLLMINALALV
ncbi:ParA family protein, partial [Stenotrophomonas sp. HMWF003]|uniref:ParA family protein n=1 Tax=Stenotrophomonas sp. HMWF003 TaxID=2056840 RepID=UPI000D453E5A